jgi:hypothetical protein
MATLNRSPPLRIAVLADSLDQPRWLVEAMLQLAGADFVDIVLLAAHHQPGHRLPLWWRAGQHLERRLFDIDYNPDQLLNLRQALPGCSFQWVPQSKMLRSTWKNAEISPLQLNAIFVLGEMAADEFTGLASFGIWRYGFGEQWRPDPGRAGLEELAGGQPLSRLGLRVMRGAGEEAIVGQQVIRTFPFSVARHRANLLRKATRLAEREMRRLHRQRHGGLIEAAKPLPASTSTPDLPELWHVLWPTARRALRRIGQKMTTFDQWFMAYRFDHTGPDIDFADFTCLLPPPDREWADPFPYCRDGRYYLFFEEVVFARGKGQIAVMEVWPDGRHGPPQIVLSRPYHVSYPFLIEDGGELYMVPETGANRTVELYRCERFPDRWRCVKVLLEGMETADATFHRDEQGWWMFVTSGARDSELYDELHIYHAPTLCGDWQPHPDNPVITDARHARPAGALFRQNGRLYRPAQICTPLYGSGIALGEVQALSPERYVEAPARPMLPPGNSAILGMHTLNQYQRLTVVDAFQHRSRRQIAHIRRIFPSLFPAKLTLPAGLRQASNNP